MKSIFFPSGPGSLPDEASLRLVILHHDDLAVTGRPHPSRRRVWPTSSSGPGVAEGIRTYRNALVFLLADEDAKDAMRDRVRASLAVDAIVDDPKRMGQFSSRRPEAAAIRARARPSSSRGSRSTAATATYTARRAIARPPICITPSCRRSSRARPRRPRRARSSRRCATRARSGTPSRQRTTCARRRGRDDGLSVSTKDVADYFWRDHSTQLLLDPTLLRDAIRDGVKNGAWVYYDTRSTRAWTSDGPPPGIEITSDAILYDPAEAQTARADEEAADLG